MRLQETALQDHSLWQNSKLITVNHEHKTWWVYTLVNVAMTDLQKIMKVEITHHIYKYRRWHSIGTYRIVTGNVSFIVIIKQCLESTGKSLAVMYADQGDQSKSFQDNSVPKEIPQFLPKTREMSPYMHVNQVSATSHPTQILGKHQRNNHYWKMYQRNFGQLCG